MLIVEIDGSQHSDEVDRPRTVMLEGRGFEVMRFWNSDVFLNLDGVLEVVLAAAQRRTGGEESKRRRPSPNPLPQAGEG